MKAPTIENLDSTVLSSRSLLPPQASIPKPPSFNNFQFFHIGQPAELLKRISEPDHNQEQYHSLTSSPRIVDQVLPSDHDISSIHRRSLLQALLDSEPLTSMDSSETTRIGGDDVPMTAINITGDTTAVSLSVNRRPAMRRSSDALAPSALPLENMPVDISRKELLSPSQRNYVALPRARSANPLIPHETTLAVPRFQIDSPTSATAYDDSTDSLPMSPLPKPSSERVQSRLNLFLNQLSALSSSSLFLARTTPAPLSAAAHVLHHAQHTAQVAVKGADASIDIAQTMHTLAQHSQEAALRALEVAQQSLAAAQAAHAAAEQSSAGAQSLLLGSRQARERAREAVDAVERVKVVLDAQEQDMARREEQVRNMVVDIRSIIEEIRLWVTDSEHNKYGDKSLRRRTWDPDNRKRAEEKQQLDVGIRNLTGPDTDVAGRLAGGDTREVDHNRHQITSIFSAIDRVNAVEPLHSRQPERLQLDYSSHTNENDASILPASHTIQAMANESRGADELRRAQDKRRQEVAVEKERTRISVATKTRAEKARQPAGGRVVTADGSPNGVTEDALISLPVSTDPPVLQESVQFHATNPSDAATLRSNFIPATTQAGRLVQRDLAFSLITPENSMTSPEMTVQQIPRSESSPLSEVSSEDPRALIPEGGTVVRPDPAGISQTSNVVRKSAPLTMQTIPKQEANGVVHEGRVSGTVQVTGAMRPPSASALPGSHPMPTSGHSGHVDGVSLNSELSPKVKMERNSNDGVVLPPRKASRAGLLASTTAAGLTSSQLRQSSRSLSPTGSTNNHTQPASGVGVAPPRMKKLNRTKAISDEQMKQNNGQTVAINNDLAANAKQPRNHVPSDVSPQSALDRRNVADNRVTRGRQLSRRRTPEPGRRWARSVRASTPESRSRLSDNPHQSGNDAYWTKMSQNRDGSGRGTDRWITPLITPLHPVRSPSPIRPWGASPPRRPSMHRDQHQNSSVRSPRSPPRYSRPTLYRRPDRYSPPSSPPIYNRAVTSSRPLQPPTSPQIGSRKRLRESNDHVALSDGPPGRRSWNDDSDSRRPGPWQGLSDLSPPSGPRRTSSLPRSLASRMQEPAPIALPPADAGPIENHTKTPHSSRDDPRPTQLQASVARPQDDFRTPSYRLSFSEKGRDYERDGPNAASVLGKRKKLSKDYGTEFPQGPEADRPHLLARMSDRARSPVGLGPPIRGYQNGRGYERGRGFGRGRGAPPSRGGFRGVGNRLKPLQDRIH